MLLKAIKDVDVDTVTMIAQSTDYDLQKSIYNQTTPLMYVISINSRQMVEAILSGNPDCT